VGIFPGWDVVAGTARTKVCQDGAELARILAERESGQRLWPSGSVRRSCYLVIDAAVVAWHTELGETPYETGFVQKQCDGGSVVAAVEIDCDKLVPIEVIQLHFEVAASDIEEPAGGSRDQKEEPDHEANQLADE